MTETKIKNSFVQKILPVLVILAAYVSIQMFAISGPYFSMDDKQELSHVAGVDHWWHVFGADAFMLFRPVKNILFSFFCLFPERLTFVCRLVATIIGCVCLFPVLALFRRIFRNERFALFAAAVWMLAPTLVSSVAWLSCVNIQIMCAVGALAIVLHDKAFEGLENRWQLHLAASLCLFLACVSYEQAVAVGPLIIVFDYYLRPNRFSLKRSYYAYVAYGLVTLLYLCSEEW